MSLLSHIEELQDKHLALETQINGELAHPISDSLKLIELKRKKLKLKEKIEKLKTVLPDV